MKHSLTTASRMPNAACPSPQRVSIHIADHRRLPLPAHLTCRLLRHCNVPLSTYLLTPWCSVLLEKLTGLQLVKKFPAFYGTRRFITALTSVRHLSVSWASPIQSIYPNPTLILSTHLRLGLPSGLLPSDFPTKTLYTPSPHPYAPHAQPISFYNLKFSLHPPIFGFRRKDHVE